MAGKALSLRNVLLGMLLGFIIVAGWLFYPHISAYFKTATPEIIEEATKVVREKVEAVKGSLPKEKETSSEADKSSGVEEKEPAPGPTGAEREAETTAALKESPDGEGTSGRASRPKIEPYYAGEEALWRALIKRPINPEYIDTYPQAECFKTSAEENNIPIALVLGLSGYLSNFEPDSTMAGKRGIMQLDASRRKGIKKGEAPTNPCQDISVGTRYLAGLLSKSGGAMVPALIAYRDQLEAVYPEKISKEDLAFSSKLRASVEEVLVGPFKKIDLYPFKTFDTRTAAKNFIKSIKGSAGVDLKLVQKSSRYVVSIPAGSEEERNEKADRIKKEAGVVGD